MHLCMYQWSRLSVSLFTSFSETRVLRIQVFILAGPALNPLSHLPSPQELCFIKHLGNKEFLSFVYYECYVLLDGAGDTKFNGSVIRPVLLRLSAWRGSTVKDSELRAPPENSEGKVKDSEPRAPPENSEGEAKQAAGSLTTIKESKLPQTLETCLFKKYILKDLKKSTPIFNHSSSLTTVKKPPSRLTHSTPVFEEKRDGCKSQYFTSYTEKRGLQSVPSNSVSSTLQTKLNDSYNMETLK